MANSFTNFLVAYSALIQAIATVVLVVLTTYYVKQVSKSASELEMTRKSEFLPILSIRMESSDLRTLDIYLSNIGRGIAQYPKVILPFESEKMAGESIAAGKENVLVTFNNVGIPEIMELPKNERVLRVEYGDIFGRIVVSEAVLTADDPDDGEVKKQTLQLADWRVILPNER